MKKSLLMAALAAAVVGGALGCGGKGGTDKAVPAADTSAVAADTVADTVDTSAVAADTDTDTTFTDKRDWKVYRIVKIGGKTWFAENLNFAAKGSVCYDNKAANCAKYGRLYTWDAAMKACPAGYHLPDDDEWTTLENTVGGSETAGTKLKSKDGWLKNGNGTDDYGFSALSGGDGNSGGSAYVVGCYGKWWSATEGNADSAWIRSMYYGREEVHRNSINKTYLYSVRCVADKEAKK